MKFIKPDGSFDFADIGTLPDGDEKAFASHTLSKYKNVDEAMKAFRHVNGLVGAKGLLPLPATATPQEREAFNKRLGEVLGIPKDAAGYGIKFNDTNQNERASMMGMQWQDGKLVTVYPDAAASAPMKFAQ